MDLWNLQVYSSITGQWKPHIVRVVGPGVSIVGVDADVFDVLGSDLLSKYLEVCDLISGVTGAILNISIYKHFPSSVWNDSGYTEGMGCSVPEM